MKRTVSLQWMFSLLAACIGAFVFCLIFSELLHPTYIAWILDVRSDPFQHFTSWLFFNAGSWTFPLSAPMLLYPIGTSIVFTDSIPLFAIIFKLLSTINILPNAPIQYFGIWLLVAFVLQALIAYFLINKVTKQPAIAVLGSILFVLSAPMLLRATGHFALTMHALILIAILLYSFPHGARKYVYWGLLFVVALLTHAYLFVMVGVLYTADMLRQWLVTKRLQSLSLLKILIVHVLVVFVTMFAAGYFSVGSNGAAATEFELFSMNAIAIVNPSDMSGIPWSRILPARGTGPGQFEGANFLGIGILIQLVILLIAVLLKKEYRLAAIQKLKQHWPLIIMAMMLTLYALSTRIWVGPYTILDFDLPRIFTPIANTFRSSGRFFWPVLYLLMLSSFTIYRVVPKKLGVLLITIIVLVQGFDMFPRVSQINRAYENKTYTSALQNPFWEAATDQYDHIVMLPGFLKTRYEDLSFFAATHDMTINDFMLARSNEAHTRALNTDQEHVRAGNIDKNTIYIVVDYRPDLYITTSTRAAANVQTIDDYIVITAQ